MIESAPLRSPGAENVFEPVTSTVRLAFDIGRLLPDVKKPDLRTWRHNLDMLHEWAHFYQFATTSYGLLFRALTAAQLLTVNGLLTLYESGARRCSLPLLSNDVPPLSKLAGDRTEGPPWLVHLRLLRLLEDYRNAIYSFGGAKPDFEDAFTDERRMMLEIVHELFGVPRVLLTWPQVFEHRADLIRLDSGQLLESHALALSSSWVAQAVEEYGLPGSIKEKVLEYANEVAVGPYRAFLEQSLLLPNEPAARIAVFCSLCDMALNPPGVHPISTAARIHLMPDSTWSPATRLWLLLRYAAQGTLPPVDPTVAGWQARLQADAKEALNLQGDYFAPFRFSADDAIDLLVGRAAALVRIDDIPRELGLCLIDSYLLFRLAEELRETWPLLLGGNNIKDLELLTRTIGGPCAACYFGDGVRVYSRFYSGLVRYGWLDEAAPFTEHDAIARLGVPAFETLRLLLYRSRHELEGVADDPLFGAAGPTLTDGLNRYDLTLRAFD